MTPYRERREKGYYSKTGKTVESTTSDKLGGLGAAQKAKEAGSKSKAKP